MRTGIVQWLMAAIGLVGGLALLTGAVFLVIQLCSSAASRGLRLVGRRHLVPGARTAREIVVRREDS
jgi:hypothetical protein